ncbi:hypothetical protein HY640_02490 [Candidatus Woesearchaeota archaeon]|nr:hypothetical protein [Candidatus Woesearchaeota archaeon]
MKAQISGQIFVYIFALIAASLVLLFGYKAVKALMDQGKEADLALLEKELRSDMAKARSYGTLMTREYSMGGYKRVCIVQTDKIRNSDSGQSMVRGDDNWPVLAKDSVESGTKKNFFLIPNGEKSFYFEDMAVSWQGRKALCIDTVKGRITMTFVGCGDATIIAKPGDSDGLCRVLEPGP